MGWSTRQLFSTLVVVLAILKVSPLIDVRHREKERATITFYSSALKIGSGQTNGGGFGMTVSVKRISNVTISSIGIQKNA